MKKADIKNYFYRMKELQSLRDKLAALKDTDRLEHLKIFYKVVQLEGSTLDINVGINYLEEEDRNFLYQKYVKKLTIMQLSHIYNISLSSVNRKTDKIIEKLGLYCD